MSVESEENEKAIQVAVQNRCEGDAGTAAGINIAPGSDDDGWVVPQPITLNDGTSVQLYKDGEALHAAYNAIQHAQRRICLEVYIFASDDTGCAFADLLCKKAAEGVRTYVIYDSFGSIDSDRKMFHKMKLAGVRLQQFHPIRPWECHYSWRPFNRDHRKLLLIDDDIAGMGGLNVGREYAGSWIIPTNEQNHECDFWRDNAIGLRGPAARHFFRSFANTWKYIQSGGRIRKAEFTHNLDALTAPPHGNELSILASVPTRNSPLRPLLHTLFSSAKKSIQLTMAYFAPDDDLIDDLCRAASRGVHVQLMLPNRCDVPTLIAAARSFYTKLLDAGIEIYERQSAVLHAKTLVIDGHTTVIGSTNLDYRSIEYNLELSSIIRSKDFGDQMAGLFRNDMNYARQITQNEWRRRPLIDRIGQWAVSRARYLL